jgi:dephospho-CoA kinase
MEEDKYPVIVAVTGGIGSGKSTVAQLIRDCGYKVISTDDLAKEVLKTTKIKAKIKTLFGESIFDDGNLNPRKMSNLVFGPSKTHEENLSKLNKIVHPVVIDKMTSELEKLVVEGEKLIFVESALIYEAELEEGFDYVISVSSPEESMIERTILRSGLSREEVKWRMDSQIPAKVKDDNADFTINNDGTPEELKSATYFIIDILKEII